MWLEEAQVNKRDNRFSGKQERGNYNTEGETLCLG